MKPKSANQKLQEKQPLFFSIGLMVALLLVITAFEWKQFQQPTVDFSKPEAGETFILPPIVSTIQPVPPRPQPVAMKKEMVEPQKATAVKEAIASIDAKDFIEKPTITILDLPALPDEEVDKTFIIVEEMPSFNGGMTAFYDFFRKNIKYPRKAERNNITGTVVISFVVDKDGSLINIEVIKGIGFGCDEEAIRVLKNAPKWNPGKQRGKPVKVSMALPIVFSLPD